MIKTDSHRKQMISLFIGVFISLLMLTGYRLFILRDMECSRDGFFHVRLALEGWNVFAAKTFPSLSMSSWTAHFADKELLYHYILGIVQSFSILAGIPEYPFHTASLFFCGFLLLMFGFTAKELKIKHLWLCIPFLIFISQNYTARMLMVRPHTFSSALLLLGFVLFMRTKDWKDCWKPFFIGFLMSWSYSNPHFLLFPAGIFAFYYFFRDKKRSCIIFGGAFLGILLGLILHPQFPNTFSNWKIQCIDVPLLVMMNKKAEYLTFGTEINLSGIDLWKSIIIFWIFCLLNLGFAFLMFLRQKRRFFIPENLIILTISVLLFIGSIRVYRIIEYAVSFNTLSLFYFITRNRAIYPWDKPWKKYAVPTVWAVVFLLLFIYIPSRISSSLFFDFRYNDYRDFLQVNKLPENTLIANIDWSDSPRLYYEHPEHRYLCALDPAFGFAAGKERMLLIEQFRRKRIFLPPEQLKTITGAEIFHVPRLEFQLADRMKYRYTLVFFSETDGYLFVMPYLARKFISKVYRSPEDSGKKNSRNQKNKRIIKSEDNKYQ